MFSSCGIGFISPALCRLETGTTRGCTEGDFSSPMKYGTIASRPGRISDYQTFKLLLILCMNKNCCKPFLRSLNCWRAVRSSFLFSQHRLQKAGNSQLGQAKEGLECSGGGQASAPTCAVFLCSPLQKDLLSSSLIAEEIPLPSSFCLPAMPWVLRYRRKVP